MDLLYLIKLFPLVYIFIESAHFISRIIKYSLSEYLIIPFMLRSTCTPMIISLCISSQLYGINFKQFYLSIPSYKYIACVTISVYKLLVYINLEQFCIFQNVSYNIIIQHHGIYHHKKPTKMRFVFDCSCTYRGTSLNKVLLQGPNLLNNLIGILCRFRIEHVSFIGDIEHMFHQF